MEGHPNAEISKAKQSGITRVSMIHILISQLQQQY